MVCFVPLCCVLCDVVCMMYCGFMDAVPFVEGVLSSQEEAVRDLRSSVPSALFGPVHYNGQSAPPHIILGLYNCWDDVSE